MRKVFISYSSKEADQANRIVEALESQGIRCWIAPRDIPIGSDYIDEIPGGIEECPYFAVLLSPRAEKSQFVKLELSQAVGDGKTIFPLLLEDYSINRGFMFLLRNTQLRSYFQDRDAVIREVVSLIRGQEPSGEECFQKGLKSYNEKDYDKAIIWLEQAYDGGEYRAAGYLGVCWYKKKHFDNAVKWYDLADGHGDIHALANKALCYCYLDKAHRDWKKAEEIFLKAEEKGHAGAKYNLGILHENGRLGAVDLLKARDYYEQAAKLGEPNSAAALDRVNKKIADGE